MRKYQSNVLLYYIMVEIFNIKKCTSDYNKNLFLTATRIIMSKNYVTFLFEITYNIISK